MRMFNPILYYITQCYIPVSTCRHKWGQILEVLVREVGVIFVRQDMPLFDLVARAFKTV